VCTLAAMPKEVLHHTFGKNGILLWQRAHGIDHSPVVPYYEQKSISTETTFETDTIDVKKLKIILTAMVEKLGYKLRSHQRLTACITVKIRYANFDTVTRQQQIPYTANDQTLIKLAQELFDKLYNRRMLIRLVGIRLSHLVQGYYQIHLFDDTEEQIRLYQAMDTLKNKHGSKTIVRASTLGIKEELREDNNMFAK
jgi:DNA polymerase IV